MKKIKLIFISFSILITAYLLFLAFLPLKKNVFYTNDERTEEYVYAKKDFPIVLVGSSLSGAFEGRHLFNQPYFNLFLPFTGCCTGVEIIRNSHKYPKFLLIEVNQFHNGIDSSLIKEIFKSPLSRFKNQVPFLQKKNKLFPNIIDRLKKPVGINTNNSAPPAILYNKLILSTQKEWHIIPDKKKMQAQFIRLTSTLDYLRRKGTTILFYEVPMDSSVNQSTLLVFERTLFEQYALKKGYTYILPDQTDVYQTGDGLHMLENAAQRYFLYFKDQINKVAGKTHAQLN